MHGSKLQSSHIPRAGMLWVSMISKPPAQSTRPRAHRPARRRIRRAIVRAVLILVLLAIAMAVAVGAYAILIIEPGIAPISASASIRVRTMVSGHHSDYLSLAAMGDWLPRATMAVEDRRFYNHGPIDPVASLRALLFDLRGGRPLQGGGTIDEQLAERLLPHDAGDPLTHALRVLLLAQRLDHTYGKTGVLTLYLNDIYYGRGAYGAGAAAAVFFGVPPVRLSLAQASFLAGLPNLPAVYGDHPTAPPAIARWHVVLHAMTRAGDITASQARQLAQAGPPPVSPG